jgi:ADP-ribosyl-[dinitrogen reductase] hydrolase
MALALARSILKAGAYNAEAAAQAYAWWYGSLPFDIGSATSVAVSAAAEAVAHGHPAAESSRAAALRDGQSNGALMRICPLGIYSAAVDEGAVVEWAREDAALTHPNPVCLGANAVFAAAISFAIRTGNGPGQVYQHALEAGQRAQVPQSVMDALRAAADGPPKDYMHQMGWVVIALHNAFWQLLTAVSAEEGVVQSVMAGGDTDTNGAIAGALLGAVHGLESIPYQWRDRVLSCRPIVGVSGVRHPRPKAFWPVDALWLAEHLLVLGFDYARACSTP